MSAQYHIFATVNPKGVYNLVHSEMNWTELQVQFSSVQFSSVSSKVTFDLLS